MTSKYFAVTVRWKGDSALDTINLRVPYLPISRLFVCPFFVFLQLHFEEKTKSVGHFNKSKNLLLFTTGIRTSGGCPARYIHPIPMCGTIYLPQPSNVSCHRLRVIFHPRVGGIGETYAFRARIAHHWVRCPQSPIPQSVHAYMK